MADVRRLDRRDQARHSPGSIGPDTGTGKGRRNDGSAHSRADQEHAAQEALRRALQGRRGAGEDRRAPAAPSGIHDRPGEEGRAVRVRPAGRGRRQDSRRRPHYPARGQRPGGARDRRGRSLRRQWITQLRAARVDGDGRLARHQGEFFRPVARAGVGRRHESEVRAMETVGFVGVGKIGMPICENLIKSGYRVLGYRRGSLAEFEKIGGVAARSPAEIGAEAEIVFSCLPSSQALDEVVQGANGLVKSARPGQIIVELGSHPVPDKERHVAPLAAQGGRFLDGEVRGPRGMVAARKAVIYLAGDKDACTKAEPFIRGFADSCLYFGPFGAASRVKLVNNLLVAIHIAATAEAMALGLKAGVDVELMIKAIAGGSGGSTQFGIRAPWMAQRRFLPPQGTAPALQHYFDMIGEFADSVGVATPLLDRAVDLYDKFIQMGLGEKDVAAMVDVIGALPRRKARD